MGTKNVFYSLRLNHPIKWNQNNHKLKTFVNFAWLFQSRESMCDNSCAYGNEHGYCCISIRLSHGFWRWKFVCYQSISKSIQIT